MIGSPQLVRWAYSEAKAIDESIAQMFHMSHSLKFVTGRFFNTVGPRQSGAYGMVLPRFVSAAIKNQPISIYGDGSQSRVFCHVSDAVARAFGHLGIGTVLVLASPQKSPSVSSCSLSKLHHHGAIWLL